jgi:uncharacterized protein
MNRRDWLLLYLALKGAPAGLDPVKIQKGMFLFAMEADVPDHEKYEFRPYNYGPMSPQIYSDLEALEAEGHISSEKAPGYSWRYYRPTESGIERARALRDAADRDAVHKLFEIKADVAQKSFNALLRDVYERYPAYAARSVFSQA